MEEESARNVCLIASHGTAIVFTAGNFETMRSARQIIFSDLGIQQFELQEIRAVFFGHRGQVPLLVPFHR